MSLLRNRVRDLIDRLTDEELERVWPILEEIYYDFYLLKAIEVAKQSLQPGDTLTREEALRYLQS